MASSVELQSMFHPKSLAIIGISRSTPSLGQMILDNIVASSYEGDIHLVNPKAVEIAGRPVINNLEDLPPDLDLAILLVPPKFTSQTLAALRCRHVIIITAGFDEQAEQDIMAAANGMTVVGPNSMGLFSRAVNSSFSPVSIVPGNFGYISQSGSIIAVVQELITNHSLGFSVFVSLGNKLDLTEMELLDYLSSDARTSIIGAYLESFSEPLQLRSLLAKVSLQKPVILVKGGRTEEGSAAVSSHTGALAGNFRLTRSLLQDSGAIMVPTIEEQVGLARFIDQYGIQSHTGVVTVSSAGGPGVLAADEIVEYGLQLAQLSEETVKQLSSVIPPFGNHTNPIDLVADAGIDRYLASLRVLDQDPAVSTILVIIVVPVLIETEPLLDAIDQLKLDTPIVCAYLGPRFSSYDHYEHLIVYQTTKEIAQILSRINSYHHWLTTAEQRLPGPITASQLPFIDNVHQLLHAYGFSYPPTLRTTNLEEARVWFKLQSRSVVMKLDHPQFSHKTDVGGVVLDIGNLNELEEAWTDLSAIYQQYDIAKEKAIIELQPFYRGGIELVAGLIRDPQFGHFLLIGAGGTMVELWDDTIFLPLPTTAFAIDEGLASLKITRLLDGFRGSTPVNKSKLISLLLKFNDIVTDHPQITELDINPLYVLSEEMVVLDARMSSD